MNFFKLLQKDILFFFLTLSVSLAPTVAKADMEVFVTILPQKYIVEKLAGDLINVNLLVRPGANPHTYEPSPQQMATLARAKAYFAIGVNLEKTWLPRLNAANRSMRIIPTQRDVKKIPMVTRGPEVPEDHSIHDDHNRKKEHEHTADKGKSSDHTLHAGCNHDHETLDPHIWLDPELVRIIAKNTCKGLIKIDPAHKTRYEANLATFLKEVNELDKKIASILQNIPEDKRTFLVFHPSWGYFAKRYNLTQLAIEDSGNQPGPKHLARIIKYCREHHIKVVFVQPQFSQKSANVIARAIGATVAPLDPLAKDWNSNLLHAAKAFMARRAGSR